MGDILQIRKFIDCTLKNFYHDLCQIESHLSIESDSINSPQFDLSDSHYYDERSIKGHKIDRALEFGCGDGRWLEYFSQYFPQVDGCDISPWQLSLAKKRGLASELFQVDYEKLTDVPNGVYDLIYSISLFQHLPVYDLRRLYLQEFLKKLKSGGYIAIQMGGGLIHFNESPDRWGFAKYKDNLEWCRWTNSRYDVQILDYEEVKEDLISIGYVNVEVNKLLDSNDDNFSKGPMFHTEHILLRGFKP